MPLCTDKRAGVYTLSANTGLPGITQRRVQELAKKAGRPFNSLAYPTVGRLSVWLLSRLLFVYPRDLHNAATSWTLVNPAVIYIFINNCKFVFLFILC